MSTTLSNTIRQESESEIFWGEMSPCEHILHIYEDDSEFLDSLEGFVTGGLRDGQGVIVLATAAHLKALYDRLAAQGVDVEAARSADQYIALDADECLSKFIVNAWPDDDLFRQFVTGLLTRARRDGRRVRAFGEIVAVLWAQGLNGATVRLEYLWHEYCREERFPLFCAYPKIGFTQEASRSIREICETHSRVIDEAAVLPLLGEADAGVFRNT